MNRNWLVIGVMAVALAVMVGYGIHNAHKGGSRSNFAVAKVNGQPAPDFQLIDAATGKSVKLSDYRGKAVLLNFWATWCPPCKVEIPWFIDLQKQYANDGLVVLGVAMDDSTQQEIAKFAKDMGINYPILMGTEKVGNEYGGVDALPTTFYIGRDGKVVDRVFGLRSHGEVEQEVKAALSTKPSSQSAQVQSPDHVADAAVPAGTVPADAAGVQ